MNYFQQLLRLLTRGFNKPEPLPRDTGYRPYTPVPEDYRLGAVAKKVKYPNGHGLIFYLPVGELQNRGQEKFTCTNHSTNNDLEVEFKWLIKNEPDSPVIKFIKDEGGLIDGEVNISERFDAWASGTGVYGGGNNFKRVCDSKRHNGFLFEHEWPYVDDNDEFIKTPSVELIQRARNRAKVLDIQYEFVSPESFVNSLQYGSSVTCGFAWPNPNDGIYPRSGNPINHAFLGFEYEQNRTKEIFDSYLDRQVAGDFIKDLAWNYNLGWGVQLTVGMKQPMFNITAIKDLLIRGFRYIQRTDRANGGRGQIYELTETGYRELSEEEKKQLGLRGIAEKGDMTGVWESLFTSLTKDV